MNKKEYMIWLHNIEGIGNKTLENLLKIFGNAENIFKAPAERINKLKGINHHVVHNILKNRNSCYIGELTNKIKKKNIDVIGRKNEKYPENLKYIYDPPYLLYKKGNIFKEDVNAVAIVGARKASSYGKYVAYKLAGDLAKREITVVSGMAYGVDTMAHKGALENGGRTIAVLGCGLDTCYPKSNYHLMLEIEKNGAVISEYSIETKPFPGNFPARNRIISGMSKGVIVVEASVKSGSLITAEFALEQGREVFAVPGNINSSLSMGTNKLIKEGAKPVTDVEDVLEELQIQTNHKEEKKVPLSDVESEVYGVILDKQPIHMDLLFQELGFKVDKISSIITILQLKGLVEQLPGNLLIVK
ncbi:DNA-processing protein DprA [Crassaminicella profunda]|uniref:DNA-processing protein DprA n=1 Tax=Crassaminicella profunda TaxID=1286698 RepID=UPI001CA62B85|nr:DNA-processing protein DprA [Crassaminicella profunda]QZY56739.1 DNA-processing protein DprA [Crassaminicella profunda]